MKFIDISVSKYEADDGKVFDWKNQEEHTDEDGTINHLNAKILYLAKGDSIDNYIEVDKEIE